MTQSTHHHLRLLASPWSGVYGTCAESGRRFGRHWHAGYGMGILEQGAQRSASGRGIVEAFAGDVITTNPGEVHDGQPLTGAGRRWRMVYFDGPALAALGDVAAGEPVFSRPVLRDGRLYGALRRLLVRLECWNAHGASADAGFVLACEEAFVHACAHMLPSPGAGGRTQAGGGRLSTVRERLADAPLEPPSLAELAELAGLSKYQLLRRFSTTYGMPPYAWLLQQRAERARDLIRHGAALAVAAAAAGFADQSHMTRVFVRAFGFTPGAWRQAACVGRCPQ